MVPSLKIWKDSDILQTTQNTGTENLCHPHADTNQHELCKDGSDVYEKYANECCNNSFLLT